MVISAWPCRIIPPNLVPISLSNPELLTFYRNSRWRPLPSWTIKLCEFGTFHHINGVVLELYTKFGSNVLYSLRSTPFFPNIHLMTSRKLTSGFDFWSCGYLRIVTGHLYTKFGANTFIQTEVIDIFFEIQDGGRRHLGFLRYVNVSISRSDGSLVLELCTKFGSNICYSHWDRRTYAPLVHLMTSRELTSGFDFS